MGFQDWNCNLQHCAYGKYGFDLHEGSPGTSEIVCAGVVCITQITDIIKNIFSLSGLQNFQNSEELKLLSKANATPEKDINCGPVSQTEIS
jgi:uncharacterized protein YsxB (DUF464 family)